MMPDAEVLAVQWAKANTALNAILGGRVATRLPKEPTFPFLTVFRVTGGPDRSEAPLDIPFLQWDAYAGKAGDASPDYATASLVARTLVEEMRLIVSPISISTHGIIMGFGRPTGPRRMTEPLTGWARYMVEGEMVTR